jgi:endonuclease I
VRRVVLICLAVWLVQAGVTAQPPVGYYSTAGDLTGKALQQALHDIIDEHTSVTYSDLWTCFQTTDAKADGKVWDMYSDIPGGIPAYVYTFITSQCGNYDGEGDCYNREHSFPKSWFNDASPMYTDLFHIYPTDGWVNNKRGNLPFGETSSPTWTSTNGSMVGPSSTPGYSGVVFEPIDEYKGDFARTYFYMATRYYGEDGEWPGSDMTDGAQPKPWALDMLLAWHRADAVSTKETNRNNEVYKYQNNRNPFIDNPQFVEKIWGTLNSAGVTTSASVSLNIFPNPASNRVNISAADMACSDIMVYLFDTGGCLVREETLDDGVTTISLDGLPAGIYIVRAVCDGRVAGSALLVTVK